MYMQDLRARKINHVIPEPPAGLLGRIMARIAEERHTASARRKAAWCGVALAGSVFALVPAFAALRSELGASGFGALASLLFSDPGVVATAFNDFALSLLESLPVSAAFVFTAALAVFFGSLKLFAQQWSLARMKLANR